MPLRSPSLLVASVLMLLYSGHAAPDSASYWEDPNWKARLVDSIQSAIRWAENDRLGFKPSTVTVEFDYSDGKLINPAIVTPTGSEYLDRVVVKAINEAHPPSVYGEDHPVVHRVQVTMDIEPNEVQFREYIDSLFSENLHFPDSAYPDEPVAVYLDVKYLDGKFVSIDADGLPGSENLRSSITNIIAAIQPSAPPPDLVGKKLEFMVNLCVTRVIKNCAHVKGAHRSSNLLLFLNPG